MIFQLSHITSYRDVQKPFVHLHVHTEYSRRWSAASIRSLSVPPSWACRRLQSPITAQCSASLTSTSGKKAGIKPIIGMEGYLARRTMDDRDPKLDNRPFHLLMLAKNEPAIKTCSILPARRSFAAMTAPRPRIDRDFLAAHSGILLAATSGCLAGQIPSMIMDGKEREARESIHWHHKPSGVTISIWNYKATPLTNSRRSTTG